MAPLGGLLRLFIFGALVGSFFDGFHTYGGMTSYPHPIVFRMAWWTMPLFGGAFVLLGLTYAALRRGDQTGPRRPSLWVGFAVFGALYFMTGFLPAGHVTKLAILLGGFALLVARVDRSRAAWGTGLIAAFAGPAFELVLVKLGVFAHLEPDLAGLPIWLPGLYLASGPGLGPLAHEALIRS